MDVISRLSRLPPCLQCSTNTITQGCPSEASLQTMVMHLLSPIRKKTSIKFSASAYNAHAVQPYPSLFLSHQQQPISPQQADLSTPGPAHRLLTSPSLPGRAVSHAETSPSLEKARSLFAMDSYYTLISSSISTSHNCLTIWRGSKVVTAVCCSQDPPGAPDTGILHTNVLKID